MISFASPSTSITRPSRAIAGEHFRIARIDRAILHRAGRVDVVLELLALNPDPRLGKEIDSVEMIPMHVRDDDVRDVLRTHAGLRDRLARLHEIRRLPSRDEIVAIEAGVHDHVAAVRTLEQPDHHRDVEPPTRVGARESIRTP